MTATSIARIVLPSLALVAACGAAIVFGITHVRHEPPVETRAATAVPAILPPASGARDEGSAALATAQAEANALSERVTRSSPARLRQARLWSCCATATSMIERSQVHPDNSSWSLLAYLLEITS
jgi:hypothetical protein